VTEIADLPIDGMGSRPAVGSIQSVVGPDGIFVAIGIGEVKPPPAREAEDGFDDRSTGRFDFGLGPFEFAAVKDDQSGSACGIGLSVRLEESSVETGILESRVFRSKIGE
jgi:hypothetical protein